MVVFLNLVSFSLLRRLHRRMVLLPIFAVFVILLLLFMIAPAPASAVNAPLDTSAETCFVDAINQTRTDAGLPTLWVNPNVTLFARTHAQHMADAGKIFHSSDLASADVGWSRLGENVGVGPSCSALHDAFVASLGHYANIVGDFTRIGVGVRVTASGMMWVVMDFSKNAADTVPPPVVVTPPLVAPLPASGFIDVPDTHLFARDITVFADVGITQGCGPTTFCPDRPVTRGEMAAFLTRALKLPSTPTDFFSDDSSSIFENDINRLAAAGITSGCGPTTFCPDRPVTRGEMAAFLTRALKLPSTLVNFFTDDTGSIFENDINRLAAADITRGCNPPASSRFCPKAPVTRGQMAAFLVRALKLAAPSVP